MKITAKVLSSATFFDPLSNSLKLYLKLSERKHAKPLGNTLCNQSKQATTGVNDIN